MKGSERHKQKPEPKRKRLLLQALKASVVVGSLAWVAFLLEGAWREFAARLPELNPTLLSAGLTFGILAGLLAFHAFSIILSAISPRRPSARLLGHLYFSAQLMKHLPGRFFGIVYQVTTTKGQIPASRWIAANALHMMLVMFFALVISMAIVLVETSLISALAWISVCLVAGALAWRPSLNDNLSRVLRRLRVPLASKIQAGFSILTNISATHKRRISVALALSWLCHLVAWGAFADAHPELSYPEGFRICALYTIAWLAGYLSFITPSGLGVRELVFATLARDLPPDAIAYGLILGRLSMLVIDLILGLLFLRTDHDYHEAN